MGITHVIRGDDLLTNAFRQTHISRALDWAEPVFAHVPLIHGPDGAKLSKRHGALGVEAYRDMGYLPEALPNYLLRLGWRHRDAEIISTQQAIGWFPAATLGPAAARFDFAKPTNPNRHTLLHAPRSGSTTPPPIFEVRAVLGPEETLGRLADAVSAPAAA